MRIKCRLYYCVYIQASGAPQRRSLRRRAGVRIWPASVPCRDCRAAQTYGGRADIPAGAPGPALGKRRRRTAPCGRCRRRCELIPASIPGAGGRGGCAFPLPQTEFMRRTGVVCLRAGRGADMRKTGRGRAGKTTEKPAQARAAPPARERTRAAAAGAVQGAIRRDFGPGGPRTRLQNFGRADIMTVYRQK